MSNKLTEEEKAFLAEVKADREREKAMEHRRELPRYDFTEAEENLQNWYSPKELSDRLKMKALECAAIEDVAGTIRDMQLAVVDVCNFLDKIKEVEQ